MKITLATAFFLCAFVAFVKANNFEGLVKETGDLEDELEALEIQDAPMGPPKPSVNLDNAYKAFLACFLDKHKGMMDEKCIEEFKELLPADIKGFKKRKLMRCAVHSFKNCTRKPKKHEAFDCMRHFSDCVNSVEEGSGWF